MSLSTAKQKFTHEAVDFFIKTDMKFNHQFKQDKSNKKQKKISKRWNYNQSLKTPPTNLILQNSRTVMEGLGTVVPRSLEVEKVSEVKKKEGSALRINFSGYFNPENHLPIDNRIIKKLQKGYFRVRVGL
jgi:hypothetical protein